MADVPSKKTDWVFILSILSFLLTILTIGLSIALFLLAEKDKEITYQVDSPSLIFDSNNPASSIKLYEKDSVPIEENVYLLTGAIWNSGDLSIKKEDVRRDLSIELDSLNRIIDFKILEQKDPEIAKFSLSKKSTNALEINWDYFDKGDGLKFQIIYSGDIDHKMKLSGKIAEIKNFLYTDVQQQKKFSLVMVFEGVFMIVLCGVLIFMFARRYYKYKYTDFGDAVKLELGDEEFSLFLKDRWFSIFIYAPPAFFSLIISIYYWYQYLYYTSLPF